MNDINHAKAVENIIYAGQQAKENSKKALTKKQLQKEMQRISEIIAFYAPRL